MKKLLLLLLVFGFSQTYSQLKNPYGLEVINEYSIYKKSVELDKNKQLIEIKKRIPTIKLDIRYAGKNNFAKQSQFTILNRQTVEFFINNDYTILQVQ